MTHFHFWYDVIAGIVMGASIIYAAFPTWEQFNDYPRFQSAYKFFMIFVIKIASFNWRSMLRPDIQATANQGGTTSK